MSIEERAEQYAKKQNLENVNPSGIVRFKIAEAYIAGTKENSIVWHKVADGDLPNDTRSVLNEYGTPVYYVTSCQKWYESFTPLTEMKNVIAWCEIPRYEGIGK